MKSGGDALKKRTASFWKSIEFLKKKNGINIQIKREQMFIDFR